MTRAVTLAEIAAEEVLSVDTTNSRIGIGSTQPTVKLDVNGVVVATAFTGDGTGLTGVANTAIINSDQLNVIGVATASSFVGNITGNVTGNASGTAGGLTGTPDITVRNITGVAATFTGVLTYEDVTNVDSVGIVTARGGLRVVGGGVTAVGVATFYNGIDLNTSNSKINTGSGVNVVFQDQGTDKIHFEVSTQSIRPQTANTGEVGNATYPFNKVTTQILDATGGVNVTGIVTASAGVQVGSGQSFGANGPTAVYYGDGSNLTGISVGLSTEAFTSSGIVTAVRLGTAQDHKITATGFTTITSSGSGTEGESHTIRIVNSGIATVGFSTYFLFPSGAAPSMPTADGAVSLISFTVHDSVGAGCTQLLAGASLNYS